MTPSNDLDLRTAGWTKNRHHAISAFLLALRSEGYEIHPAAEAFLSEFGDLTVVFTRQKGSSASREDFIVNPIVALDTLTRERVETYEMRARGRLIPVGAAFKKHMSMLISEEGALYGAFDDLLIMYGGDIDSALTAMKTGQGKRVPEAM